MNCRKILLRLNFLLIVLVFSSCSYSPDLGPDQSVWEYASPSETNVNEQMLLNLDNEIRQGNRGVINSLHIVKDDKLIYESYYNPVHSRNSNHVLNAITLSISSALVGTALEQGLINSIDDPISDYLPDYDDIFTLEPEKSAISINHLLTMRSGIAWNENIIPFSDPSSNLFQMTNSSDWVRYVLEQEQKRRLVYDTLLTAQQLL